MRAIRWRAMVHAVVTAVVVLVIMAGLGPSAAGAAGAVRAASTAGAATAATAQSEPELAHREATLSPAEATAGEEITVRAVAPGCIAGPDEHGDLVWAVFPRGAFAWGENLGWAPEDAIVSSAGQPVDAGDPFRGWTVTFPAPDLGDGPPAGGDIGPGSPVTDGVLPVYGPLPFTVDGHELDFVAKCYTHPRGPGEITLTPEVPELGGTATVTTDDPCPMPHTQGGAVALELWSAPAVDASLGQFDISEIASVPVDGDGSWSATVDIPADPERRYALAAHCRNVEGGNTLGYWLLPFDVREPSGPPIGTPPGFWDDAPGVPGAETPGPAGGPAAPAAAPAEAVPGDPDYTG